MAIASELHASAVKGLLRRYLRLLRSQQAALNRLNVYPVPDGDTGSNMAATMETVVEHSEKASGMDEVAGAIAHGSLLGAQGNSGIILSQVLRAIAATLEGRDELDAGGFSEAIGRASSAAYQAVGRPVEGTILTVLRETAAAVAESDHTDLAATVAVAYRVAEESLRRTPTLLPVLAEAGVVDAGGAGLLLLFAAVIEEVVGETPPLPTDLLSAEADLPRIDDPDKEASIADLRYEVMFLLDGPDGGGDRLKEAWAGIGDSIVVVGGDGSWSCHIHTDHIGGAIEAGIAEGRPYRIKITDLAEQAAAAEIHGDSLFEPLPEARKAKVGVVAVAAGRGIIGVFRQYGVQGVVVGGQTMNPSVGDLLTTVEAVPAKTVIVLPNNKNVVPAAEQLDALTRKTIHVIPTRSILQGITSLIGYEPGADAAVTVREMTDAFAGLTSGEMTRAVRDARTPAGTIRAGDWLGIVDGTVSVIKPSGRSSRVWGRLESWTVGKGRHGRWTEAREQNAELEALIALMEATVHQDHEIVTLFTGHGARPEVAAGAAAWLAEERPAVTLQAVEGGQPLYPYLIGSE
ncbi:MAG: DAK2 domain-containing protein [Acidimicrobiia bacterium]|nr:DAK2 domain-containing protein [Acidimicrobiia bacterium]